MPKLKKTKVKKSMAKKTNSKKSHLSFFRTASNPSKVQVIAIVLSLAILGTAYSVFAASSNSQYLAPDTYTTCGKAPCWCPGQSLTDINQKGGMEYSMRCMVNYARKVKGVHQLALNDKLVSAAISRNRDIVACRDFSHTACGNSFTKYFSSTGYIPGTSYWYVGENLAWGSGTSGSSRSRMNAWLNSSEHRANIFDPRFRDQGMSVRLSAQLFGSPNVYTWVDDFGCHNSSVCQ